MFLLVLGVVALLDGGKRVLPTVPKVTCPLSEALTQEVLLDVDAIANTRLYHEAGAPIKHILELYVAKVLTTFTHNVK